MEPKIAFYIFLKQGLVHTLLKVGISGRSPTSPTSSESIFSGAQLALIPHGISHKNKIYRPKGSSRTRNHDRNSS